ncbi:EI24 domain-containing protein [Robbsia andropogonis]|uniref:EI24 domain-containing protein n=1 Tax=Robbsia andropogonis TaxID=28092 RepID=UPI003D2287F4
MRSNGEFRQNTEVIASLARAISGFFNPRVWWLTVAPFVMSAAIWGLLLYAGWERATGWVRAFLAQWPVLDGVERAIAFIGLGGLHLVFAPFLVVAVAIPLIVVTILLLIGVTSMPAVIAHLSRRRFAHLDALHGGSLLGSIGYGTWSTLIFVVLMIVTLPLWFVPPFMAIVRPALWGWLTYRMMSYDALALHASADERRSLLRRHRTPLLAIGIVCGLLGAVPALLFATSAITIVLFPVIALISVWLYVVIFVFSALWFGHYCLRALEALREETPPPVRQVRDA